MPAPLPQKHVDLQHLLLDRSHDVLLEGRGLPKQLEGLHNDGQPRKMRDGVLHRPKTLRVNAFGGQNQGLHFLLLAVERKQFLKDRHLQSQSLVETKSGIEHFEMG